MTDITPWQTLYEEDCDSNEDGIATFCSNKYMQDEIDLLRVRNSELERDAARYRFIRQNTDDAVNIALSCVEETMDEEIDAALNLTK